jgi:hypothetical protein
VANEVHEHENSTERQLVLFTNVSTPASLCARIVLLVEPHCASCSVCCDHSAINSAVVVVYYH